MWNAAPAWKPLKVEAFEPRDALKGIPILALVMAAGLLGGGTSLRAQESRPALASFDEEAESLYRQIHSSLARVSISQSAAAVLNSRPDLKTAFDDSRKNAASAPGPGAGGPGPGTQGQGGRGGRDGRDFGSRGDNRGDNRGNQP